MGWIGGIMRRGAARVVAAPLRGIHRLRFGKQATLEVAVTATEDAAGAAAAVVSLQAAASDPRVRGVFMRYEDSPGGWATAAELRAAMLNLRACGKRVTFWAPSLDNLGVYLASAADEVSVPELGDVSFTGLGTELMFLGDLLEMLGIEADFVAAGAYKSFGEMWTRNSASPANLEAVELLLRDLQDELTRGVTEGRRLDPAAVQAAMSEAPLSAARAVELGLIDRVAYVDEARAPLEEEHDLVDFDAWWRSAKRLRWLDAAGTSDRVVVVFLEGQVTYEAAEGRTALDAVSAVELLDELGEDDDVRAVVLVVNSPGGSALASDLIWRSVERLREKVPVVSWFGDVAASGGYYLAAGTPIVARPASLTGSIGVFGGKLALGGLARRLGITAQPVTAGEGALWDRPFRRFSDAERERFKRMLSETYDAFVRRVAAGRGVPVEQIEPHCQGRTWSGTSAARVGLVEQLGGLDDAVALALARANVAADRVWREHVSLHPRPWWVALARSFVGLQAGVPSLLSAWVHAALAGRPDRSTRDAAARAAAALEQLHGPPAALALWTWLRAPR